MIWLLLSLLSAITNSTADYCSKKSVANIDEYMVSFSWVFFALPVVLIALIFVGMPTLGSMYWPSLISGGLLNVLALILTMKALRLSPLSLTIPMLAFTPVFTLLTSPIILNEFPSAGGVFGISLVTLGAYLLNFTNLKKGIFYPFKEMKKEKGPLLMLMVAMIFSVAANIDKVGLKSSNTIFWLVSLDLFISSIFVILMWIRGVKISDIVLKNKKNLAPIGLFAGLSQIFQIFSITLTIVPYAVSVKRTSILFSSLYGFAFLKETKMKQRILAISVMVSGIVLIAIG